MLSDYHVHSDLSFDCNEPAVNQVKKAIELGMNQICFTEHVDIGWNYNNEQALVNMEEYNKTITKLRNEFSNQIEILQGMEVGLTYDNLEETKKFIESNNFDFVITSIHELDNNDPYYPDFWEGKNESQVIKLYFETMYDLIKRFPYANTLGHMDYIARYCPSKSYSPMEYTDIVDNILNYLIDNDIALEINTSNLAKGNSEPNPHSYIIERYNQLGGKKVTVGSDSHKSDLLGFSFNEIEKTIKKYDFDIVTI